jgi:hypothetical protein
MALCCSALGDVFIPVGSGRWHEQGRESCCQDPEKEVAMLKLLKGIAYITPIVPLFPILLLHFLVRGQRQAEDLQKEASGWRDAYRDADSGVLACNGCDLRALAIASKPHHIRQGLDSTHGWLACRTLPFCWICLHI